MERPDTPLPDAEPATEHAPGLPETEETPTSTRTEGIAVPVCAGGIPSSTRAERAPDSDRAEPAAGPSPAAPGKSLAEGAPGVRAGWRFGVGPMGRYVTAATLARCADGGAAVGLVSLTVGTAGHSHGGAAAGGLLAALLTAPHLLGPWSAQRLDRARDGRKVLATAFAGYGLALAAGAALIGRAPLAVVAALITVAGICGPLLTGGLSSRLAGIAGSRPRAQRRAEGWDSVTYGLGGTAGPAAIAGVAAVTTPLFAMLGIAAATAVSAAVTMTLPRQEALGRPPAPERPESPPDTRPDPPEFTPAARPDLAADAAMSVRAALRTVLDPGPLRRVMVATGLTAFGGGGMLVIAVVFGGRLSPHPGAGAALAAVFGLGNLAGSLAVTAFPLRGEPERSTVRNVVIVALTLAVCAVVPNYPAALVAFAAVGFADAPMFTASLAARSLYAPPGARAQVFVSMAGLKVALASAGSALAGAAIGAGPRPLIVGAALVTLLAAAAAVLDRRRTTRGQENSAYSWRR